MRFCDLKIGDWFTIENSYFNEIPYAVKCDDNYGCFFTSFGMQGMKYCFLDNYKVEFISRCDFLRPLIINRYMTEAKYPKSHSIIEPAYNFLLFKPCNIFSIEDCNTASTFIKTYENDFVCFDSNNYKLIGRVFEESCLFKNKIYYYGTDEVKNLVIDEMENL